VSDRVLRGTAVSPGIAYGPALVVHWEVPAVDDRPIGPEEVETEIERLREAMTFAKERLLGVRARAAERAGPEEARIFDAQILMLEDPDLLEGVERLIRDNHFSAERAFELKMLEWRSMWTTQGSALLRDRLVDLADLEVRVLTRLLGVDEPDVLEGHDGPVVLVARDLTPSLTVQLDREAVLAIACELGTRTSHAAILAHSIGIPAIVGVRDAMESVRTGEMILLDGWAGTIEVEPDEESVAAARARDARRRKMVSDLQEGVRLPATTADGVALTLRANIDLPEEVDAAVKGGAQGVGLMRTEFLVVGRGRMPTEEEQAALYRRIGSAFGGHDVVIRTYDIGGDKFPASFRATQEANPFLGWRAIRVCLDQPEVFRPQIRAILRAAATAPLRLMVPLVTRMDEIVITREMVAEEAKGLKRAGIAAAEKLPVGVMVETPAAVMIADQLARVADFLSVGTNDLVQYTLAVDRGNARLADRFEPHHPAVLRSLVMIQRAGAEANIEVSVCGGMASDPISAFVLLALGYRTFSVAAPSLPLVRWLIRQLDVAEATGTASALLAAAGAAEATRIAREALARRVDLKLLEPV